MRSRLPGIVFLLLLALAAIVAWFVLPHRVGPVETLRLSRASFADLPGWNQSDPRAALAAFQRSCTVNQSKPPDTKLGDYAGKVSDWRDACAAANRVDANDARAFFEQRFDVFAIEGDALFTGYYEPLLHGSRTRHDAYQTPVYALPADLVSVDLGAFRPEMKGEHIAGRVDAQRLIPYATRADIDTKPPQTKVIFYGDDPVSVFFMHIQGSGRVALDDGSVIRVAYAGQNGHPYTPIGRTLIHSGALARENVSMQSIRAWLTANPSAAQTVMQSDESYVFFKETAAGDGNLGSAGAQGVPLTPLASIAVDLRIHPLGVPFFIAATTPGGKPLQSLFIAQDTGGAIRGPARADIFFGFGSAAGNLAGAMKSTGRFYLLLPKVVAAKLPP